MRDYCLPFFSEQFDQLFLLFDETINLSCFPIKEDSDSSLFFFGWDRYKDISNF